MNLFHWDGREMMGSAQMWRWRWRKRGTRVCLGFIGWMHLLTTHPGVCSLWNGIPIFLSLLPYLGGGRTHQSTVALLLAKKKNVALPLSICTLFIY